MLDVFVVHSLVLLRSSECCLKTVYVKCKCKNTIIVSKMSSHFTGSEQEKKDKKNWDKRERRNLRRERQVERDGAAVTYDGKLFHRRADMIENAVKATVVDQCP